MPSTIRQQQTPRSSSKLNRCVTVWLLLIVAAVSGLAGSVFSPNANALTGLMDSYSKYDGCNPAVTSTPNGAAKEVGKVSSKSREGQLQGFSQQEESILPPSTNAQEQPRSRWPPSRTRKGGRSGHGEHEILITSLISGLFRENVMPPGAVLDVGAQFGEQAAHFAYLEPDRTVYALDPSPTNIAKITEEYGHLFANLKIIRAGLARNDGKVSASTPGFQVTNMEQDAEFDVYSLDSFFRNQTVGFAHLDIEGLELEALKGGTEKFLTKDRPIFTMEIMGVHKDPQYTRDILTFVSSYGYDSYMVDEVCGNRMDFRNILNIPRELSAGLQFSDTFNLAMATKTLKYVDVKTLGNGGYFDIFALVYPCCRLGGECCPSQQNCCFEKQVVKWLTKNNITRPDAMTGFQTAYVDTVKLWWRLRERGKNAPTEYLREPV